MRKTIIALMLVLPLLFVFVIFSSVNVASLGVNIAANGISILNKSSLNNDTLRIDLADYNEQFKLEVAVSPENATNKGYTFKVEGVEGSDLADVSIDNDGVISARGEGAARIVAVSNDGGYRDSVNVMVGSSKAYDFDFALFDSEGEVELAVDENGNYSADVSTGRYTYKTNIYPRGFTLTNVEVSSSHASIDAGARSILIPFGEQVELTVTVPDGVDGDIIKTVTLNASKQITANGITVNGEQGNIIAVETGAKKASFYLESDVAPTSLSAMFGIEDFEVQEVDGLEGCYVIDVTLSDNIISDFTAVLSVGDEEIELSFTFRAFDFSLTSDLPILESDGVMVASIIRGTPVNFYAVAAVAAENISYVWGVDSLDYDDTILAPSDSGTSCIVDTDTEGEFTLWVEAYRNDSPIGLVKEITVSVISRVYGVQITNDNSADLAARYTVGGQRYNEQGVIERNRYLLDVRTFYDAGGNDGGISGVNDLIYIISDPSKASIEIDNGVWLVPQGTGEVTVSFAWKGNETFDTNYTASITLNVVRNGVEVSNAPELVKATAAGLEVILTDDIMLGTDESGNVLDISIRRSMLGSMKSTYNIDWYKNSGLESSAYINYVMEFKDDVYGNGHTINAEHFTNAMDGTGTPLLFRGPLFFVSMGDMASVAGQDNCAFLIRTDGVMLYGVNLLGCSDESLTNDQGQYDLSKLNKVGNVLEINADADVVNCRIRNGRNVVRVYGGNRDGNEYFINSLSENAGGVSNEDRIKVRIEGCIISQGREFLVKTGANRALRALKASGGAQPDLLDSNGKPYRVQTNDYVNDNYFYNQYVMTDLTLKDSVLETSGLFSIGVESNFSGSMLYKDLEDEIVSSTANWLGTGGTSFAAVLRLEGDVRMYDWKDISLVDSSTLIESGSGGMSEWLKLNVAAMIDYVQTNDPDNFGNISKDVDGRKFVHGGIAVYGGGNNYAQIITDNMGSSLSDLTEYKINISVLSDAGGNLGMQGSTLPNAAGTQDFRFYMYDANSANSYQKQQSDASSGTKYDGVKPIPAF